MGATGYKTTKRRVNRTATAQGRDEYHRSHEDAAVGATIGATERGITSRMTTAATATAKFSRIPRQTKRSRDQ